MIDAPAARPFATRLADWRRSLPVVAGPVRLREERAGDEPAREALLDAAFGATARRAKTCERLREGRAPAAGLSFVAVAGTIVGTLRFWPVEAGDREALMLGPLAVSDSWRSAGIGRALVQHGLRRARKLGHSSVILVGDAPYYGRFGFRRAHTLGLTLPGPVEEARFLGLDLVPGALAGAKGRVVGTGVFLGAVLQGDYGLAA